MDISRVLRHYVNGTIALRELNEVLAAKGIHGEVKGTEFTGYDYDNQAWITVKLS